ncbi:MAG: ribbon-helix-helix domain-containing protein [Alphaproteobacteria bacterium]|nr:ribbon-helix-helix domain-containing protein [Alphaproteobacteria bacterium]
MLNLDDAKLEKHSVTIAGHRTSISLERGFWRHLRRLAAEQNLSMNELVRLIDEARTGSLSGALRAFVLQSLEKDLH